jgi:signal transduction histidine kinase
MGAPDEMAESPGNQGESIRLRRRTDKPLRDLIDIIHFTEDVSAKIHGVLDESRIYRTVREEFARSEEYNASILLFTDDGSQLNVVETSLTPSQQAAWFGTEDGSVDLNSTAIYRDVVIQGITLKVGIEDALGTDLLSGHAKSRSMPYEEKFTILTPLMRHGRIIGALGVSSPELSEYFIPSVKSLAQHISTALELADEYADRTKAEEELRNLSEHLQTVREEERTGIAREIHDELGQALTVLKMDLSWVKNRLPDEGEDLLGRTESMLNLTDETIHTVKKICTELRPGLLDDLGICAAIEWQAGEFEKRTGIKCMVKFDPDDISLEPKRSTAIFRIFQEALTNVARHANASRVDASLTEMGGILELDVKDNGRGISEEEATKPKSFGLIGMRERIHFLRGNFQIKGKKGKGTTLRVSIPLQ